MVTLPARILNPFMNCSFVSGKIPLWNCLIVTLPAKVFQPFMNCSFVLGKIPLWSCLMVTLPARVLHPFMNCSFVLSKIPLWSCLMVTLHARVLNPFMRLLLNLTLWSHFMHFISWFLGTLSWCCFKFSFVTNCVPLMLQLWLKELSSVFWLNIHVS